MRDLAAGDVDSGPEPPSGPRRVIAHCDLDAFYASVELLKAPELRGQAARRVRNRTARGGHHRQLRGPPVRCRLGDAGLAGPCAMPARRLPDAGFHRLSGQVARGVGHRARAGAGLSAGRHRRGLPRCHAVRAAARRFCASSSPPCTARPGWSCRSGVGPSKLVAKTVSSNFKPRAFAALSREQACERFGGQFDPRPAGGGPQDLRAPGRHGDRDGGRTSAGALRAPGRALRRQRRPLPARAGLVHRRLARGRRPARPNHAPTRRRFPTDVSDRAELEAVLARLTEELCDGLRTRDVRGRNIAIKVRLDDWTTVTRARTIAERTNDPERRAGRRARPVPGLRALASGASARGARWRPSATRRRRAGRRRRRPAQAAGLGSRPFSTAPRPACAGPRGRADARRRARPGRRRRRGGCPRARRRRPAGRR